MNAPRGLVIPFLFAFALGLLPPLAANAALPTANLTLRFETTGATPYNVSGGRVTNWVDQASPANNAVGVAAGPALIASGTPSGKPSLRFAATNRLDVAGLAALNGKQTLSWFIVFKQGNAAPGTMLRTDTATLNKYWGTYNQAGLISHSRNAANGQVGPSATFIERNNWHISSAIWNGTGAAVNGTAATNVFAWVDGGSLGAGSATGANGSPGNHVQTTIGMNNDGSVPFTGELAAVLVYDTCLSAADRRDVEAYLRDTYFKASLNPALQPFLTPAASFLDRKMWDGSGGRTLITATNGALIIMADDHYQLSTDGGATWGPTTYIADALGKEAKAVVNEVNGNILYVAPMDTRLFRSTDNGVSWRKEIGIPFSPNSLGHTPDGIQANQPGITIKYGPNAGRLLIPARVMPGGNVTAARPDHYNTAIYSDDNGASWQTSEPFPQYATGEAALAENCNGNILYSSREHCTQDFRHFAWSYTGGSNWTDHLLSPVLPDGPRGSSYGCMGGLVRLPVPGADIVFYSNLDTDAGAMPSEPCGSTTVGREKITVWVSFDGGVTWPVKRRIYSGPSGYSNLAVGRTGKPSEGKIYLDYEGGPGGSDTETHVATFTLAWLLDGRNIDDFFNPGSNSGDYWTGSGDGNWNAAGNWLDGSAPTWGNTADVVFHTTGAANLTTAAMGGGDRTVRSLSFTANADSAVTINLADTALTTSRNLTFDSDADTPSITLASGATGNITIGGGAAGNVVLADNLTITHNGSGTLTINHPVTESSSGRSLTKSGSGMLTLSGANTYTGQTTVYAGVMQLGAGGGTGSLNPASIIAIGPGGTLASSRSDNVGIANNLAGTGVITKLTPAEVNVTGTNSFSGTVNLPAGTGAFTFNSTTSDDGQPAVIANGRLAIGSPFVGTTCTIGNLTGAGQVDPQYGSTTGTRTLQVNQTTDGTFSGILTDATSGAIRILALTKTGPATLTVSGANTYTGATTVGSGTLLVNGALGNSAVTVNGGTLGGTGVIKGAVLVQSGGTLSPGTSIGTLSISNSLTLAGTTFMEINASNGQRDFVQGLTSVSYGGSLAVSNLAGTPTNGQSFQLFSVPGTRTGNFTNISPALSGGKVWSFNPTNGVLSVVATTASYPTNISFSFSGGMLSLTWPASHLGWFAQSNAVSLASPGNWFDIAGSSASTSLIIIPSPERTNVFYRLRSP